VTSVKEAVTSFIVNVKRLKNLLFLAVFKVMKRKKITEIESFSFSSLTDELFEENFLLCRKENNSVKLS
jgi:hypothetical protein